MYLLFVRCGIIKATSYREVPMPAVSLAQLYNGTRLTNQNGVPLAGGRIYTYVAGGGSTPATTYTDTTGTIANTNPIILTADGSIDLPIWIDNAVAYRFEVTDSLGASVPNLGIDNVTAAATQASLSAYVTNTSLASTLTGYPTNGQLTTALVPYALSSALANYVTNTANLLNIKQVVRQNFNATGTYTPSTGMLFCDVFIVGAGGGGGGATAAGGSFTIGAGGGGAGAFAQGIFSAATIGGSQPVTIGAAGSGGAPGLGGSAGAVSVFGGGSLLIANGGAGGGGGAANINLGGIFLGGAGGVAGGTAYQIIVQGENGDYGIGFGPTGPNAVGGKGGNGPFGAGGPSAVNGAGNTATGLGSGGGGASVAAGSASVAGGNGTTGFCTITEYLR